MEGRDTSGHVYMLGCPTTPPRWERVPESLALRRRLRRDQMNRPDQMPENTLASFVSATISLYSIASLPRTRALAARWITYGLQT
jgi:hypothetical protein